MPEGDPRPGVDLSTAEQISLEWIEDDMPRDLMEGSRAYDRISGKNKTKEQLLQQIRDRLEGSRPVSVTQIGIACEEPDRQVVEGIIPVIRHSTGFSVVCHGLSLLDFKKSRGVLLYWGHADGKRLRQARLILKDHFAFFVAPPTKPEDDRKQLGSAVLYQQADEFHIDDIRPFLERMGWKS